MAYTATAGDYESHRDKINQRGRESSQASRDIASKFIWEPANLARREACRMDLERYLRTYYPRAFPRLFCADHSRMIERIQEAAIGGGLYARAMFRGSGKTTIFARAMLWATKYAHRKFGVVVGATERDARRIMKGQKSELWQNELLIEDFPEICNPFVAIADNARRCKGQLFQGRETLIEWAGDMVVYATIPPAVESGAAGSILVTRAITGAIKGLQHLTQDGQILRPDFVLLDDVQTRESAKSAIANEERMQTIDGDVLGLAGHDTPITAVMAVTPIYDGDLACTYLDRSKKPAWRGETAAMLYAMPAREDLWDQYRQIQDEARRNDGDPLAATRFYAEHRADMDAGAVVAWEHGYPSGTLSALQYAMDLKFRSPQAFAAEYQCKPLSTELAPGLMLGRDDIARKTSGLEAGVVPPDADYLVAFVDPGDCYLFYAVCAFRADFSGTCIEYGAWPPQRKRYFSKGEANPSIADFLAEIRPELAGSPSKTLLAAALDMCLPDLLGRTWQRHDGPVGLSRLLVDTGYEADVVRGCIQRISTLRQATMPLVMPTKGVGITATKKPLADYVAKTGDAVGWHWRAVKPEPGKLRTVDIDTNHYKSVLHQALFSPLGRGGCFTLFGTERTDHSMMADHLTAETPRIVENKTDDRTLVQWEQKPGRDNEGLDCLVGCFCAAATLGAKLPGASEPERRRSAPPIRLSQLRSAR